MEEARKTVASFMARLYERQLTTACGGNVSLREGGLMYITPSSLDKSCIPPDKIAIVDIDSGENLTPALRLSIESGMHRQIYLQRPDAVAVVHSHPLYASLFSALEEEIDTRLIAEPCYLLGTVTKADYALMGTAELAQNVAAAAARSNAVLLRNHGALTIGHSMLEAYERMEVLENAARMTYLVHPAVHAQPLCKEQLEEIWRNFT